MANRKLKEHMRFRHSMQAIVGLVQNSFFKGYLTGKIYRGPLKNFCLPGMNCYSCPGALGACPIGSLQAVIGKRNKFPFYVLGYLVLIGLLCGRFVCGWLCLFGLIQELLFSIPSKKLQIPENADKRLRKLKYVILVVTVFFLTGFVKVENGLVSVPYFCKYFCPVGMLEGGIPLVSLNQELRNSIGWRYIWKGFLLALTLLSSIFIYRPFCKYVCPLGALYGLVQRFSFLRIRVDTDKCIGCNTCAKHCRMNVNVTQNPNSSECIRCGECTKICPESALSFGISDKPHTKAFSPMEESADKKWKKTRLIITIAALLSGGIIIFAVNHSPAQPAYDHSKLEFTTTDMDGREVKSSELFASSELSLLNVWASYCAPCVRELPELSALNRELADSGVQIVTLLWDSDSSYSEEAQTASEILKQGQVELICLLHNDQLESLLADDIIGMPTSFLVNSEGQIVAPPRTNSDSMENYRAWIEEYMK